MYIPGFIYFSFGYDFSINKILQLRKPNLLSILQETNPKTKVKSPQNLSNYMIVSLESQSYISKVSITKTPKIDYQTKSSNKTMIQT